MTRLMEVLKALALTTLIVCGAGAFVLLLQVSSAVRHADRELAAVAGAAGGVLDGAAATTARAGKLVDDARLTTDNVNRAAIDERMYFERDVPALMDQAHGILGNVQRATADLDPLLNETTARVHGLQKVEDGSADLFVHVNGMMADPRIWATLGNVEASTAQLAIASREAAATGASVQAMAADGQQEVHTLLHPKPLVSIADWTLKVVHAVGGFF
jgi:hypothetical protein